MDRLKDGFPFVQLYFDTVARYFDCPEEADLWELSGVEVVDLSFCLIARTELKDVHSNKGECRLVDIPVGAPETAFHEPHIRVHKGEP